MFRKQTRLSSIVVAVIVFSLSSSSIALAQSGRGRRNTPPTQPQPKPTDEKKPVNPYKPTVLNVPDGGQIVKRDGDSLTQRFVLKNGLTVIIRERPASGLTALTTYVKTGYFDEPDETAGLAHLMEHMFFKGTATRLAGTIATDTRRLGGVLNASASYEKTSYYVVSPAESLAKALEIQADLLLNPTFDPEELRKEALVVIQESKRKQDNATALALERMFGTAFTTHRMKRWRIGSDDVLKAATREQLLEFYQRHYTPKNTVLVIVGDVITSQVIGRVQQLYGNFAEKTVAPTTPTTPTTATSTKPQTTSPTQPQANSTTAAPSSQPQAAPVPSPSGLTEAPQDKLRYSNERGDIGQTVVTVGYHVAGLQATPESLKEQAALEVLSAVLGLGRGSRLSRTLRESQKSEMDGAITEITTDYLPLPGVGMLNVQLRIDPNRLDKAEAEYFREIERFRREIISEGELQRAKSLLEKRHINSITAASDEAEELARHQALLGDYRLLNSRLARLRAVTAQDIQQAAAKYLIQNNTTVHEYEPLSAQARTFTAEKFAELISVFAPTSTQPVDPKEVKPAVALRRVPQGPERGGEDESNLVAGAPLPIKDYSVFRGPRAYVREDHSRRKLTVGVFFQGGRLIEDATTSGTTEMMLRCLLKSTTSRKADLIAHELESYGGEIQIVNEPDFFGYTLDVLSRNAENATKLLVDIVENPFFDKAEIAREQASLLARQLQQRDDGIQRPIELMMASLYPNHPYGLPRYGLPNVVKSISEENLETWHNRTIKRQFPLVIMVGDTDGSALVASLFTEGFKRNSSNLDQALKVSLPSLTSPQEQIESRSRKQTAQAIGFRTADGKSPDNYALQVIQNFAAGLGGRLFTELRDKRSLAYTVSLRQQPGLASGALIVYTATSPENEQQVRELLQAELAKLISNPPTDEELERGRNAAIGSYAVGLEQHTARTIEYGRAIMLGRKPTDVETQPDLIRAVKKEDIKRVAEAVIKITSAGRGVLRGETTPAGSN